jgi:hypothetical protein
MPKYSKLGSRRQQGGNRLNSSLIVHYITFKDTAR